MNSSNLAKSIITPNWLVDKRIQAISTTRLGGVSTPPWNSLNLATHVNDDLDNVFKNREQLKQRCKLPNEPTWLEQTHSNDIVRLTNENCLQSSKADATHTTEKNIVCCVMTADCLPILLCNKQATWVAAVHAGWKGIANGILRKMLKLYVNEIGGELSDLQLWLGPAIGGDAYQVGADVKDAFMQQDLALENAFINNVDGRYLLNSVSAAKIQLNQSGINSNQISAPIFCTYHDGERFFSYRRDGANSGRMASMIWLA